MHAFDLTPLLRSTIGFERIARELDPRNRVAQTSAYPPYNIEKTSENNYHLSMAVAGFRKEDLDITLQEDKLVITGSKTEDREQPEYLYRGIASRNFEHRFQLADDIKIVGAALQDGMLYIHMRREIPESKKPRQIAIETKSNEALQCGAPRKVTQEAA